MIGSDDQASAQKAVAALSKIVAQDKLASERNGVKDKRVNNRLKDLKIASQIAAALSNQSDDDGNTDFANECIALLQELTTSQKFDKYGICLHQIPSTHVSSCSSISSRGPRK